MVFFGHGFCNISLPDNLVNLFQGKKEVLESGEFLVWCSVLKYVIDPSVAERASRGLLFGNALEALEWLCLDARLF